MKLREIIEILGRCTGYEGSLNGDDYYTTAQDVVRLGGT